MDTRIFILLLLSAVLGLSAATAPDTTQSSGWGTISVEPREEDALLKWTPDAARRPDRFLVQKRKEGTAFRALRQVMSDQPYQFREKNEAGTEYRIIEIDTDGTVSYSPVVSL